MSRSLVLLSVGLALLAFPGCATVTQFFSGSAEALESDGMRTLRPTLRPIRGTTRVLIFGLDGVGDEALRGALDAGAMPHVAALLGPATGEPGLWAHAWAAPDVVSAFPAVTVAGWAQAFTGASPAENGIVGGEWFDRDSVQLYAPVPISVSSTDHTVATYADSLVNRTLGAPTLYEQAGLRAHVSFSQIYRGADVLTTPAADDLLSFLGGALEGLVDDESVEQEVFEEMDESSVESIIDAIEEYGLPDIQTVYFPGIDLFTHVADAPLEEQRDYLHDVLDPAIGTVLDAYRMRRALEQTFVLFIADHGHTPVLEDSLHALVGEDLAPAPLREAGFRVRPFELEIDSTAQDFQAVLAYQDGTAYVYLADRSACPDAGQECDWARPPRLEEDVLPVARAYYEANARGTGAPGLEGTLDLILARRTNASGAPAPFEVFDGERLVPVADYLAAEPRPDLVRFAERLDNLTDGPYGHRAGDVLLLARSGDDLEDRFYFSPPHTSGHGGAGRQDSVVPLLVARFGASGVALRQLVGSAVGDAPSQRAVTPLVQTLLEAESSGR